jgi:hypothetical protein
MPHMRGRVCHAWARWASGDFEQRAVAFDELATEPSAVEALHGVAACALAEPRAQAAVFHDLEQCAHEVLDVARLVAEAGASLDEHFRGAARPRTTSF